MAAFHCTRVRGCLKFGTKEISSGDSLHEICLLNWLCQDVNDPKGSLLSLATSLVKEFPQYPDVVVSVARKTESQMWPLLFDTVGRPSEILDVLLKEGEHRLMSLCNLTIEAPGASHSAACLLVVIDKMEGGVLARALALQVLQIALTSGEYDLVAELLRYAITQSDFDLIFSKDKSPVTPPEEPESMLGSWLSWMWGGSKESGTSSQSRDNRPVVMSGASFEAARVIQATCLVLCIHAQ